MGTLGESKPPRGDPTLVGRTVLVIEDHPDSRDVLEGALKALRAHVLIASSVDEAERKVSFYGANLIVCDLYLPDETGLDFIKWLRAQPTAIRATPCIAITGYEEYFPAKAAIGFDAYMRKPIDLDKFCAIAVALAGQR